MELVIFFGFISSLVLLDVLAMRYGADSRLDRSRPEI